MKYVCLWSRDWSIGGGPAPEEAARLLEVVPRVVVERRGVVWADVRGLSGVEIVGALLDRAGPGEVRAGMAAVPVVAEVATRVGAGRVREVGAGEERAFLAPLPLSLLGPEEKLLSLFEGVGVECCGELAALEREAVEVRFGPEGVRLWRLARADDPRRLFAPIPPERPHASLDFIDYVVTDPERLVFTANALLGSVTAELRSRGEHARRLSLTLELAGGGSWQRTIRPARPTASREVWLRLVRGVFERVSIPDAVAGVRLEVEAAEAAVSYQGDLFDRGFATVSAVEAALARLIESQGAVVVEPVDTEHPLPERRREWVAIDPLDRPSADARGRGAGGGLAGSRKGAPYTGVSDRVDGAAEVVPRLSLQLLPEPRPIDVESDEWRDHLRPVRYRDRSGWRRLVTVSGPDRVSGGRWEEPYAREYFRCVTEEGALVWLFRDARLGTWFLHGWWD